MKLDSYHPPIGLALASTLLIAGGAAQAAGQNTCTQSSIEFAPPVLTGVTAGTNVEITGRVTEANSQPGCTGGTHGAAVEEGDLAITGPHTNTGASTEGIPKECKDHGNGPFRTYTTVALPNPSDPPGSDDVTYDVFTTGFPDATYGYRTEYTGSNDFASSESPCVDIDFVASEDGVCGGYEDVVVLRIQGAAGQGVVDAGDDGPWDYTIEVLNCTGIDDLPVKVEGGTSEWTSFKEAVTVPGEDWTATPRSKGKNGTTETITWPTVLDDEEMKTITVTVDGIVQGYPGEMLWLSGPWSAAYDNGDPLNDNNCNLNKDVYLCKGDKSLYTPRVFVQVTPPAP